jgi:regulatory protein
LPDQPAPGSASRSPRFKAEPRDAIDPRIQRRPRESFADGRERRAAIDDPAVVLEAAARFLEARSRSVTEVRRRLGRAGYRAELIDGAITRMTELGMLDDEAFGRAWVESRDRARPRGEIALRRELALKGVDRAIVDEVLEERRASGGPSTDSEGVDLEAARRLIARNERSLARVADPRRRRQRAYALLARNGFDPETCRVVASAVALAIGEDDDGATGPTEE